ncbi:glycosyltransferase family 4 protein [Eggerthella sinensis]|uniref:Glycosyl transferase family 1 domain-containing protein n=1 Tax=Eggerthella sinensis TaxID=242230 RepID=A0A3N0IWK6_9ACTN|nr:glycosyltransferase [Eggerthella sinensis]MCB7039412.1 glycosyltransferase [Eggerthella sinensis]RDB65388.1 hypothetical protein C1876_15930 [Eggerthella sinensis]RNM41384.1 hypothetical protein DMP09_09905 [Eggerthella sinensis]
MNVMWLCSTPLPYVSKHYGRSIAVQGGWISGAFHDLIESGCRSLCVCYPQAVKRDVEIFKDGRLLACGFPWSRKKESYDSTIDLFKAMLKRVNPDVVHIFGTEHEFCEAMVVAAADVGILAKTVVSIQGLVSEYSKAFCPDIPAITMHATTISELKSRTNLMAQKKSYYVRGMNEIRLLGRIEHVMGRTMWDYAHCKRFNQNVSYHHCGETLRTEFYEAEPGYATSSHNIFFSQGGKPIKALYHLIRAMEIVLERFPDAKVFISGTNGFKSSLLKGSSYDRYLNRLSRDLGVGGSLVFLGEINATGVIDAMRKCACFVSTSSIENSPNSMGEAMMLGLPCIASFVGGVPDMAIHQKEAYLYTWGDIGLLSHYIMSVFEEPRRAFDIGFSGMKRAREINHSRSANKQALLGAYEEIAGKGVDPCG